MQSKTEQVKRLPFFECHFVEQSNQFKIQIASHFGMCFGVRDAIKLAESVASKGAVTILGELVHNEAVRKKMTDLGAREGDLFGSRATTREVLVTAHGASDREKARWREMGYLLRDSTCPLVKKAHSALTALVAGGYFPVVVGKPGHVEVRGLTGDFPNACVVERVEDLVNLPFKKKYGVVSQTTQPISLVETLVTEMKLRFPGSEVCFKDTVCQPTKNRQTALADLIANCDLILVVGGRNSNNSAQLVEAARQAGVDSELISGADEVRPEDLRGRARVGVTAGTSTQKTCVDQVVKALEALGGRRT